MEIIGSVNIPAELGELILPNKNLNGPSSKVLNDNILKPLGVTRENTWLCDMLPESRLNPNELNVIREPICCLHYGSSKLRQVG